MDIALRDCPRTEDAMSRHCVETLSNGLLGWSSSAISWVQKAARPLRTSELAIAMALTTAHSSSPSSFYVSPHPSKPTLRYLGVLLRVDGDLVHFYIANTRRFLTEKRPGAQEVRNLQLLTHEQLVSVYLRYIFEVVSKESEDICLAQITWRHQVQDHVRQAALGFLDFAVRHWPTHYLLIFSGGLNGKTLVENREN